MNQNTSALSSWGYEIPLPEATPSRWCAFRVLRNQVRRTIEPGIPLKEVLTDGQAISRDLSKPGRKASTPVGTVLSEIRNRW